MSQSQEELIRSAQAGNEASFTELINLSLPKLRNLLQHQFKITEPDVEDILQVSFIKAWKKIDMFRGDSAFSTWLYVVIKNEALNFLNKKNNITKHELPVYGMFKDNNITQNSHSDDAFDFLLSSSKEEMFSESAEMLLEKKEELAQYRKIIDDAISQLSPTHNQIIKMILEDELSYKEVSEKLKIPIGTVMSRFHYARRAAQKSIQEQAEKEQVPLPF